MITSALDRRHSSSLAILISSSHGMKARKLKKQRDADRRAQELREEGRKQYFENKAQVDIFSKPINIFMK